MPVTILDIAIARDVKKNEDGSISAGEIYALGLPFFAGCEHCQASLGPAQSFPSTSGYIQCRHCIGENGFDTAEDFAIWEQAEADREIAEDTFPN